MVPSVKCCSATSRTIAGEKSSKVVTYCSIYGLKLLNCMFVNLNKCYSMLLILFCYFTKDFWVRPPTKEVPYFVRENFTKSDYYDLKYHKIQIIIIPIIICPHCTTKTKLPLKDAPPRWINCKQCISPHICNVYLPHSNVVLHNGSHH